MTFCGSRECVHLSAGGEHGRRFREDTTSRGGGFFRCRFPGGLAGEQNEEEVFGLEEETAAREAVRDPEEAGFGLNGNVKFVTWANECNRPGSLPNLSVLKEEFLKMASPEPLSNAFSHRHLPFMVFMILKVQEFIVFLLTKTDLRCNSNNM